MTIPVAGTVAPVVFPVRPMSGQNGELLRYTVNIAQGWMALWNSSALVSMMGGWDPHGNVYNASGVTSPGVLADGPKRAWMWNITIPKGLTGSAQALHLGDRVFGAEVGIYAVKSWAFSLKPGQEGTLLFNTTWTPPTSWAESNRTSSVRINAVSLDDGVFTVVNVDSRQNWGFSTNTGQLVWGPTDPQPYLDQYQEAMSIIANGRYIVGAESGVVQAYNVTTGALLWKYEVKDIFNENPVGVNWPLRAPTAIIADGKIYGGYGEHSPNQPLARGAPFFCLNESTGELIWQQYMVVSSYSYTPTIGDSIVATLNSYDNQIYTIGKGPSTITVEAPLSSNEIGKSLIIQGSVMDNSPGVKQAGLELRFPNGVPVASDASMSEWMRYVYMQFAKPSNVIGVEVSIDVIDSNGNYRNIGTTTSDSSGDFSFAWKPDISGKFTVIATFAGSKSYYPSYDQTAFVVDEAASTPSPYPVTILPPTEMYIIAGVAAIIVAIAIGFATTILVLRKRP